MAAAPTDRIKVYRWSSDNDDFTRAQMDESHEKIEERVAIFLEPTATLPTEAPAEQERSFHFVTGTNVLYFTADGTNWVPLNSFATPSGTITPGSTNTEGVSTSIVRADHVHALPAWGSTTEPVGTSASAGDDVLFARADHVHVVGTGAINSASMLGSNVVEASAIASDAVVTAKIQDAAVTSAKLAAGVGVPAGTIMAFGGTTKPTGWEWCDGTAYSSSNPSYTALFNAIGTRYGSGSGGNNFNVPDFRDHLLRGASTVGGAVVTQGADTATIGTANLPAHTHTYSGDTGNSFPEQHVHGVSITTGNQSQGHVHSISHSHTGTVSNNTVRSTSGDSNAFIVPADGNPSGAWGQAAEPGTLFSNKHLRSSAATLQSQAVAVSSHSGNSGGISANHNHDVVGSTAASGSHTHQFSGTTSSVGSGTALSVLPKSRSVNWIIKL
jgi:microcystin-dependent protein